VRNWLAGKATLPSETQAYVRHVTGRSAEEWAKTDEPLPALAVPRDLPCVGFANFATRPPPAMIAPRSRLSATSAARLAALPPLPVGASEGARPLPATPWAVQLIGDSSESRALTLYRDLQKRHQGLLGGYQPVVLRTAIRGAAPVWSRVRVNASSRQAAELLCSGLKTAGESCLVQRN
jgi:hypothetical protein